ncbi:hypothetical protein [Sporomusa silvacetica]
MAGSTIRGERISMEIVLEDAAREYIKWKSKDNAIMISLVELPGGG